MSQALERVIAQQQEEIDRLKVAAPCHNPAGTVRQSINNAITALRERLARQDQDGPLCDGWQLSIADGHEGYGVYAHMTEYPEEGAVFLMAVGQPEPARQEDEPYGRMTVVKREGYADQHWFYPWPEPPYLDNAAECHTLYTRPQPAAPAPAAAKELAGWKDEAQRMREERDYWMRRAEVMREHQKKECWYWQGDGEDHLESLVGSLPVVIRADELQAMLKHAAPAIPEGYALIGIEALKAWGKYDEVVAACRYPAATAPSPKENT